MRRSFNNLPLSLSIWRFNPFLFALFILFSLDISAQNADNGGEGSVRSPRSVKGFSWNEGQDPFAKKAFVPAEGQYEPRLPKDAEVLYGTDVGSGIHFTKKGLIYRIKPLPPSKEQAEQEDEGAKDRKDAESEEKDPIHLRMEWQGASPDVELEVKKPTDHYFTFGDAPEVKTEGYKKLIYKGLYPGIDVHFSFPPDRSGLKYKVVVHPEGDLDDLRMVYKGISGDSVRMTEKGDIEVLTEYGRVRDHAPSSVKWGGEKSSASFKVEGNAVAFQGPEGYEGDKELRIDPWIVTPGYLSTLDYPESMAFDVDMDDAGNVYVSGGEDPFKLVKYSPYGNVLWTYDTPISNWTQDWYSEFAVLPSGRVFIGEGLNSNGPKVVEIAPNGVQQQISANFTGTIEFFVMFYNRCTDQLMGFGGDYTGPNNLQVIADTNLSSATPKNFNNSTGSYNDIADAVMDYNGDFYALISTHSTSNNPNHDEQLEKGLAPNYNSLGFSVPSGYVLDEWDASMMPVIGQMENNSTVHWNGLALNDSYLYSYDGKTLKVWDKSNGNLLDSQVADPSYPAGRDKLHEGIDVDQCNNVYVGGDSKVHVFQFDGNSFSPNGVYDSLVTDRVYDVHLSPANSALMICGRDFVSKRAPIGCLDTLDVYFSKLEPDCDTMGAITVDSVEGGNPPFDYSWSTGDTTSSISGLNPGDYDLTVSKQSCGSSFAVDTTITLKWQGSLQVDSIDKVRPTCSSPCGGSLDINVSGASSNLQFSIDSGNSFQTDSLFTGLCEGTFDVIVQDDSCTYYEEVELVEDPEFQASFSVDSPQCHGQCSGQIDVSTSGGNLPFQFSKDSGSTFQTDSLLTGLCDSTYDVVVEDDSGCVYDTSIALQEPPPMILSIDSLEDAPCGDSNGVAKINVFGGKKPYTYQWGSGTGNQTGKMADDLIPGTYTCVVTDSLGCKDSISVNVSGNTPPTVDLGNDTIICNGSSITLNANASGGTPPYTYNWSNGGFGSQITVSPSTTTEYTVYVQDDFGCTSNEDTVTVKVLPALNVSTSPDTHICKGEEVMISSTVSGGDSSYSYSWSNGSSNDSIIVAPMDTTDYTLTVTDGCGNSENATTTVYAHPYPDAEFEVDTGKGCPPFPVLFQNKTDSSMMASCSWGFGDQDSTYGCQGPKHVYDERGAYWPTLTVTSLYGCSNTDSLRIVTDECAPVLALPNVFSPNADGENDRFFPKEKRNIASLQFRVFNRWGEEIFVTEKKDFEWDGKKASGKEVPEGTYYWEVKFRGKFSEKTQKKNGSLTLLR